MSWFAKKSLIKKRVVSNSEDPKRLKDKSLFPKLSIFQDKSSEFSLIGIALVFSSLLVILSWQYSFLPPQIPFYYNLSGGERLAGKEILWLVPSVLGIFSTINLTLAQLNYKREPVLSRVLIIALFFIIFLSFLGVLKIIGLVI
ncbi:hypothetical protein COS81_03630 [candidate division WWE3 bacterium CG06_land_8_20_14_3_00_42_16]|uniref:DUF1648 domain-containing protein n=4 Tax=Katanobacteria TaxID=422282 RepID=A0A2M7AMC9_UNCKA|nr:MAG: hypothetical protein AUJ38_02065 [bacterium CG1_02_42_9]PIU68548.1 MAG: hypothetical protein COS81_03630 [candidate division WWE3 bacterium CG06_land_8_20_14_3_00_42_16]PIZ43073.1 MAG: hypothetical protein COY34_01610 [candidate division WWE3 bacterium CG_4_10_14_0_2_um_filter_42_8]PJA37149.1 MAG: hypothetical protein CO181_04680 [candidate division WWE3 bacterium CG_4_9_14_3_um_filter_43_9]PJC69489.1 MAG: hypothetical protein CO015_00075 [candidate division WWE3 bacterium CG_4_8_14_3_u